MWRRFLSLAAVFVFLFALSSCGGKSADNPPDTPAINEIQTTGTQETVSFYNEIPETTTQETTTASQDQTTAVTTTEVTTMSEDFSSWDTSKILEFYKNAVSATGASVKSSQTVELQDISVNNGQLGGMFSFVTPILSSFISSSTTETDGITGAPAALTTADISTAKAYAGTNGTVVEITLNGQTDNASVAGSDGSVARGISTVGDLGSIISQLKDKGLPLDIPVENAVITYTNPLIKAVVDKDGKIINGTWSCTVEISITNYKFAGSQVDSTKVILGNTFTVGGGFNP